MIIVGNAIISDDIIEKHFVCDLIKCKGACCVEGDLGAPIDIEEIELIKENLASILPYITESGREVIENEGFYLKDWEGDFSTTTVDGKECSFAVYKENGILSCGIEQAWRDGKSTFRKPISCHLYPIRIDKYGDNEALNYNRWDICSPACDNGLSLKVHIHEFLKEPLIRKYGEEWYNQLVKEVKIKNALE